MTPRLLLGDCIEVMRTLDVCSVDAVVCDPPYNLAFMGLAFDSVGSPRAFQEWCEEWARECLRILKPGGHLVAFGAPRAYHRLACGIEDAGFEVRDSLIWAFGCMDAETECLTRRGWLTHDQLRADDDVLQWDHTTGALSWTRPDAIHRYPFDGKLAHIANRHTDQRLTPNHRVYARVRTHSRNPKPDTYEVYEAERIAHRSGAWQVTLPMAGTLNDGVDVDPEYAYLVGWFLTDAWLHRDGKAVMFSQAKPETLAKLKAALAPYAPSEYTKVPRKPTHNAEHTFYVSGAIAARLRHEFPGRRLPWDVLGWSRAARQRLYDGLMDGDGSQPTDQHAHTFWSKDAERRDIFLALCVSLDMRAFIHAKKHCVFVNTNTNTTEVQGVHRVEDVPYTGTVWCLTVPTGAFVVRRSGRPFITGNSGFPKSLDVSKAIDKAAGAEREVVGPPPYTRGRATQRYSETRRVSYDYDPQPITAPATEAARKWQGFGTSLKPAYESAILARKPLTGTVAETVMRWGTGAINIDGCRVGGGEPRTIDNYPSRGTQGAMSHRHAGGKGHAGEAYTTRVTTAGRWPPNLLHSGEPEVVDLFPETESGKVAPGTLRGMKSNHNVSYADMAAGSELTGYGDSGSAARFFPAFPLTPVDEEGARLFYTAKASSAERGEGCDHPTVKPVELMKWLVRLVTPPGGTVLDCFMGSGTTGIAARSQGFHFIGIEREPEYMAIAEQRMGADYGAVPRVVSKPKDDAVQPTLFAAVTSPGRAK